MAQVSNQAWDRDRAVSHAPSTTATSGGACPTVISPRRSWLIGLCSFLVLKTALARRRAARACA